MNTNRFLKPLKLRTVLTRELSDYLIESMWKHREGITGTDREHSSLYRVVERLEIMQSENPNNKVCTHLDMFSYYSLLRLYGGKDSESYALVKELLGTLGEDLPTGR